MKTSLRSSQKPIKIAFQPKKACKNSTRGTKRSRETLGIKS